MCALVCVLAGVMCGSGVNAADTDTAGAVPGNSAGTELVLRALGLLGVHYRFGGNTPEAGLDCSGLVRLVFREAAGLILPRRSEEISRTGESVKVDQLKPGDLVFFNTLRQAFSHVGIYVGNNQFVHAPSSGGQVRVESLSSSYWSLRYSGARRLVGGEPLARELVREARRDALPDVATASSRDPRRVTTDGGGVRPTSGDSAWSSPERWANTGAISRGYAERSAKERAPVSTAGRDQSGFDQLMGSLAARNRLNTPAAAATGPAGQSGSAPGNPPMATALPGPSAANSAATLNGGPIGGPGAMPSSSRSPVDPPGAMVN